MTRNYLFALTLLLIISSTSPAQTTAFTYQGKLADNNGNPLSGNYDFEFRLFDDLSVGAQQGTTQTAGNILVTNGIFTVTLDFVNCPDCNCTTCFDGAVRFLEIAVKPHGGGAFPAPLTPRQLITSTPYAVKSKTAANATTADTLSSACVLCISDAQIQAVNGSKVTGTVANAATATNVSGIVQIANGGTGSSTQNFVDLSTNQNNIAGNKSFTGSLTVDINTLHVDATTNMVGVGTAAPASVLHVVGPPGNGTDATEVLRVVGGAGGVGSVGGKGGGVLIQGGVGGGGSEGGSGGSITLQPGAGRPGNVVGSDGVGGNVLLAPGGGSVGVGINPGLVASASNSLYIGNDEGEVSNHFRLDGFANNLFIVANSSSASAFGAGIIFRTATPAAGETDRMAITPAGNVGIGTNAPDTKLHVSGTGIIRARIDSDSNAGVALALNNQPKWSVATVTGAHFQIFNDASGQNAFWIDSASNNIGIGTTSPLFKLHIIDATNTGLRVQTDTAGGTVASFGGVGAFQVDSNGIAGGRLTVLENGNVGLGVQAPTSRLDVGGIVTIRVLGSAGSTSLCLNPSFQIASCSSSLRYKSNINNFRFGLDLVRRLRPVTFTWKADGQKDFGLVAEEVAEVEPLLVTHSDKGEIEGVKYDRVAVVLLNAVKEQQSQIATQQTQMGNQRRLIEHQQQQLEGLKRLVCSTHRRAKACK